MAITSRAFAWLALLAGVALTVPSARAAESYDNCTGFIDSLPATITTQGVWCLRHDLNTSITSGAAITIAANNVTLDCNDFKVGGLAAGPDTQAHGIYAYSRSNVTVRNCNVRGFSRGMELFNGAAIVVEDNRLDGNTWYGIIVGGDGSLVRRNDVFDTMGTESGSGIWGIGGVDIVDNRVDLVWSDGTAAYGILVLDGAGSRISGNTVRRPHSSSSVSGIRADGWVHVRDNVVTASPGGNYSTDHGLSCTFNSKVVARENSFLGFADGLDGNCINAGGNVIVLP